jgi:hypothetical protein
MIWFFERHQARLRYEIRRAADGDGYELAITHPDGRQELEHFADPLALVERSQHLQDSLVAAGWHQPSRRHRALKAVPVPRAS